jgi:tRNA synthetase class I (M)
MAKFYITTTIPYVNAEPHIGFALEIIQADAIARYHHLLGDTVVFNFGTDEHGLKIYQKALESKKTPQEYCDEYAIKFDALKKALVLTAPTKISLGVPVAAAVIPPPIIAKISPFNEGPSVGLTESAPTAPMPMPNPILSVKPSVSLVT